MALSTATYLGAYIVDLTSVLYEISTVVTENHINRSCLDAPATYKRSSSYIHALAFTFKL